MQTFFEKFLAGEAGREDFFKAVKEWHAQGRSGDLYAYLKSWLQTIKGSPTLLIQAASAAQKSTDFILRRKRVGPLKVSEQKCKK